MGSFKPYIRIIDEILFRLIEKECSKLTERENCEKGKIYEIKNPAYGFLGVNEIKSIIKSTLSEFNIADEGYIDAYFNYLIKEKERYLIPFSNNNYRTIYMDLVSKGAVLRVAQETPRYVINPRISIVDTPIPYPFERHYKLNSNESEIKPFKDLAMKELGDKADEYFKVIDEYLGKSGLDVIQTGKLI